MIIYDILSKLLVDDDKINIPNDIISQSIFCRLALHIDGEKMEEITKKQVLEILNYWKMIEFLSQKNIPEQDSKYKKSVDKVEIFIKLTSFDFNIKGQLDKDERNCSDYLSIGENFSYCIGKIKRNTIVEYLAQYIENKNESPEVSYNENEAIAWCSL